MTERAIWGYTLFKACSISLTEGGDDTEAENGIFLVLNIHIYIITEKPFTSK